MPTDDAVVVRLQDVPMDDPLTLQLRLTVARGDGRDTFSTVWVKDDESLTLNAAMHEGGDDPALEGAAVRGAVEAIAVEERFARLSVAPGQDLDHELPDRPTVYVDTGGREHEL